MNEQDAGIVLKYYKDKNSYPLFFILCQYLKNSNERECQIFNMRYGIQNSKGMSIEEIASEFNLSRERVRQILAKSLIENTPLYGIEEWKQYFNEIIFFTPGSEYYQNIIIAEKVQISFEAFSKLYCEIFPFSYNDGFKCEYVVLSKYESVVDFAFSKLSTLKRSQFSENTYVPYSVIFKGQKFQSTIVSNLIINEVAKVLEIHVINKTFFFEQNFIDVEKDTYDFLYDKGEPIHIDYIQKHLQNKYPDHAFSISSLKFKLRGSEKIWPVGKTSMYKLSHWRNVYSGSIRDLIREIMYKQDMPIDIDEITEKVTDVFDTNKKSIHSSILGCEDFIAFGNGLFGLRDKVYPPEFIEVDLSRLRASFEDRFEQYKSFVEKYQHIPYSSGEDEEESLKRWQSNVSKKFLEVTDEQVALLEDFLNANKHLPQNGYEYNFYRMCRDYLDYVKANYELPSRTNAPSLYFWFNKQKSIADDYEDNRLRFFDELLSELRSYGFYV